MLHLLLLFIWIAWGAIIRFSNLTLKAPWSDEWATLVFSNAQSFKSIPLDRAINLDTLLLPLQYNSQTDLGGVVNNLMTESNHPPVYFLLTHPWLKLFPGETISLWGARALPALFGIASIPAIFYLTYLAFRSAKIAQIAAALMAFSPYGIYIAQEARHYTLPVLLIIASSKKSLWTYLLGIVVVLLLGGIVAPSFFNQAYKAKQSEAKQYVASINKAQQAYFFEHGKFSDNIDSLGIGILQETANYSYKIKAINDRFAISTANARNKRLRSYSGIVYVYNVGNNKTTRGMLCETDQPSLIAPDDFQGVDRCPSGSSPVE